MNFEWRPDIVAAACRDASVAVEDFHDLVVAVDDEWADGGLVLSWALRCNCTGLEHQNILIS